MKWEADPAAGSTAGQLFHRIYILSLRASAPSRHWACQNQKLPVKEESSVIVPKTSTLILWVTLSHYRTQVAFYRDIREMTLNIIE